LHAAFSARILRVCPVQGQGQKPGDIEVAVLFLIWFKVGTTSSYQSLDIPNLKKQHYLSLRIEFSTRILHCIQQAQSHGEAPRIVNGILPLCITSVSSPLLSHWIHQAQENSRIPVADLQNRQLIKTQVRLNSDNKLCYESRITAIDWIDAGG
jgi:hypothetical protein